MLSQYKPGMDGEEFKLRAKEVIDYMVHYRDTAFKRPVIALNILKSKVADLKKFIPLTVPTHGQDSFKDVLKDLDEFIVPRLLAWDHPHFFGYFPAGNTYPTILADMLSDIYNNIGFSWSSGPALTELEMIMMDWWGQALHLPRHFLFQTHGGVGGGVIQCSASDAVFMTIVSARQRALEFLKRKYPGKNEFDLVTKLVGYISREAHSCQQKGANLASCRIRVLTPNKMNKMTGETLERAIKEDLHNGLVPFFVGATVGTTGTTAYDNLWEIGAVCKRNPLIWLHVDAAYAGSAFVCEEFQHLCGGLDYADSVNVNANKWMLVCYDCSGHWVRDRYMYTHGIVITPVYLSNEIPGIIDYRHWKVQLSRRFRSLKLYFLFRVIGVKMIQEYIRNHVRLAKYFEDLILTDKRFTVTSEVHLGLVCTRLVGDDILTEHLVAFVNALGKIHVTPTRDKGQYVMRLCITYEFATKEHFLDGNTFKNVLPRL
ncbi:tyrosine decarboxylase-like isoform X3 [Nilaparvata lugens]|uniref:tyrosine decarboxylase-like isoform X3 n=1 Tax=Nilaparvata lugens TaxID=108931 RepID=UPI00193E6481|nr:tyrosine decarboxylase-like isoform X3 [Nilaparvata lugens]